MILKFNSTAIVLYTHVYTCTHTRTHTLGNIKAEGFVVVIKDHAIYYSWYKQRTRLENGFHKHDELLNRDYSLVRGTMRAVIIF